MNRLVHFILAAILLSGCTNEDFDRSPLIEPTSLDSEYSGIQKEIAINIIASHFGGYRSSEKATRAMKKFSLTPYIINGDTLLYIAQYENGWEIYSASKATNMVLFSSEEGNFDMNSPSFPDNLRFLIMENAKEVREILKTQPNYVHPSWSNLALSEKDIVKAEITAIGKGDERVKVNESDLPPGRWVQIEYEEVGSETYTSPKLIQTKWGQSYPWNAYAKFVLSIDTNKQELSLAGCTPIAVAQYLYFTHFKDGIPEKSPSGARILSNGNGYISDYIFIDYNSEVWNKMARFYYEPGTNESALLIGETGRSLDSSYGLNGTSTKEANCISFLSDTYGIQFKRTPIDYAKIIKSIKNQGYPLIAYAASNEKSDGSPSEQVVAHSFIIDQYKHTTKTYRYLFGLKRDPLPPGTVDRWIADMKDENGNIIKYAYTRELYQSSVDSRGISMNWGWSGAYDNTFYYPTSDWNAGGYNFNIQHYCNSCNN